MTPGFPRTASDSPGVKRQYSGTLGKIGNCQIGVSVHAVGERGTLPLGWALYLPEEWCADVQRRREGQDPRRGRVQDQAGARRRAGRAGRRLEAPAAPVLGDQAYGDNTRLRERLDRAGLRVRARGRADDDGVRARDDLRGAADARQERPPARRLRPDREPEPIGGLIARLRPTATQTVTLPRRPRRRARVTSRFVFVRVPPRTADAKTSAMARGAQVPPREEWLIAEWPDGRDEPTDYWLSNLPADTEPERLARLARLRWKIELDYRQLKGELGLDHYEGRSWLGWHHHTALVTAAHGFLTLERLCPNRPRPA